MLVNLTDNNNIYSVFINIYPAPTLGQALPQCWVHSSGKVGEHHTQNQTSPQENTGPTPDPRLAPACLSILILCHLHWATATGFGCLWNSAQHLSACWASLLLEGPFSHPLFSWLFTLQHSAQVSPPPGPTVETHLLSSLPFTI